MRRLGTGRTYHTPVGRRRGTSDGSKNCVSQGVGMGVGGVGGPWTCPWVDVPGWLSPCGHGCCGLRTGHGWDMDGTPTHGRDREGGGGPRGNGPPVLLPSLRGTPWSWAYLCPLICPELCIHRCSGTAVAKAGVHPCEDWTRMHGRVGHCIPAECNCCVRDRCEVDGAPLFSAGNEREFGTPCSAPQCAGDCRRSNGSPVVAHHLSPGDSETEGGSG